MITDTVDLTVQDENAVEALAKMAPKTLSNDTSNVKKQSRLSVLKTANGNKFRLRHQDRLHSKRNHELVDSDIPLISELEAVDLLRNQSGCCSFGHDIGCILKYFLDANGVIMWSEAIQCIKDCRRIISTKSSEEVFEFMYDNFVASLSDNGMRQKYPPEEAKKRRLSRRFTLKGNLTTCTKCFVEAYGLSIRHLNKISHLYKENIEDGPTETRAKVLLHMNHKKWNDDYIHEFTYAETKSIYRENLGDEVPGKHEAF